MNKTFYAALDIAIDVASKHEQELLSYPGVITIGAGTKRSKGKITGDAAIIVTVRKKISTDQLKESGIKILPEKIDGVLIDIIEAGKPVEAPEIIGAQTKAKTVLDAIKDQWLKTPNITGIGIGYKIVKGEMNFNQVALKFTVSKKLSPAELKKLKLTEIPSEINGVITDVEVMPVLRPSSSASGSRDDRKDPLVGGITVGVNTKPFWYGTLGAIVFDRSTGDQLVLSNQHVLDGPAGTEVVQPSPIGLDDSLDISFVLDFCNPLHFFRLDTPNTTVGSVLAGAAVAAAVAAALSDEIDPTRRGQEATLPEPGAKTLAESHKVKFNYPELPIPGTHFNIKTNWQYTRHTDSGDLSYAVDEVKQNPHVLLDKILFTDKKLYHPGETIKLFAFILPERCAPGNGDTHTNNPVSHEEIELLYKHADFVAPKLSVATTQSISNQPDASRAAVSIRGSKCPCHCYHLSAILTPTTVDRAFPVVLKEPVLKNAQNLLLEILQIIRKWDDKKLLERVFKMIRYGCFYTGELTIGNIPSGPWKHYLFVQTVNCTPEGMDPLKAAQVIGGLPVSQNSSPNPGVACGPLVYEDGQFDIDII
jgi:hypothetical protein